MKKKTTDDTDTRLQTLSLACVRLVRGADGIEQPRGVQASLRDLEVAELATYSDRKGWRLTPAGEKLKKELLNAARAPRAT